MRTLRSRRVLVAAALALTTLPVAVTHASEPGPPPAPSPCASVDATKPVGTWARDFWCETPWANGIGQKFVPSNTDPHVWVYTLDPATDGATGTISFDDRLNPTAPASQFCSNPEGGADNLSNPHCVPNTAMIGPDNSGVVDFQVDNPITGLRGFDFNRPSFTQDVRVPAPDYFTPDPANGGSNEIWSDWDPSSFVSPSDYFMGNNPDPLFPPTITDANLDGGLNFFKYAWTTPPGTQFNNMQIDRAGNYFVAKRDMQWGFFDELRYVDMGGTDHGSINSQFNIQPYPISNGYGWCGIINNKIIDPDSLQPMAGQLVYDVAFDAYADDGSPAKSSRPFQVVVPGFVMRSYGKYTIDVTMLANGVHQHFEGSSKPNNVTETFKPIFDPGDSTRMTIRTDNGGIDPDSGKPWSYWKNNVMAFGAGVVPTGAWVLNDQSHDIQVVPVGTPGATWHSNGPFAGAAFLVRGDILRKARYTQAPAGSSHYFGVVPYAAWSDYPAPPGYVP